MKFGRKDGISRVFRRESAMSSFLTKAFEQVVKKGFAGGVGAYLGYHISIVASRGGGDAYENVGTGLFLGAVVGMLASSRNFRSHLFNSYKIFR